MTNHLNPNAPAITDWHRDFLDIGYADNCWMVKGRKNHETNYTAVRWNGKYVNAHRLSYMLAHGIEKLDRGVFVCHICDNPPCANPHHLHLGNAKSNLDEAIARGRWSPNMKTLTDKQVDAIRYEYLTGELQIALSVKYGVTPGHINSIVNFKSRIGKGNSSKLTEDDVREIRALHSTGGFRYTELGLMYGISPSFARRVVKRIARSSVS